MKKTSSFRSTTTQTQHAEIEALDEISLESVVGGYYGLTSDPYGSANPESGGWSSWSWSYSGDGSGGGDGSVGGGGDCGDCGDGGGVGVGGSL